MPTIALVIKSMLSCIAISLDQMYIATSELLVKLWRSFVALPGDDVDKIVSENKRHSLSFHSKLALEVTKEVTKVYVDKL